VGFGQRVINLESAIRGRSGSWQGLTSGNAGIILLQHITVGQSDIAKAVIRVAVYRLLKLLYRLLYPFPGPLTPVVAPPQIELIGFRVRGFVPCELLPLFAGQLQPQLLSNRPSNVLLDGKNVRSLSVVF